jgi:glycosyltransferase involved in cell wall biosynthesis
LPDKINIQFICKSTVYCLNLPKISILLPFRDAEDVLQRAVDSILEQKIPFELVLVENQDTESEIARKLVMAHSNFKLVRETRKGIVPALNAGLAECSGIYIARMDADDEMPEWMQTMR